MTKPVNRREGWTQVAFGDVVSKVSDRVDPKRAGLERYVAGEHMGSDDLRIRRWGVIGDGYLGPAFHMRFKPGQVLYGSRRTYLRKVAVPDFEGTTANTTFVLESKDPNVLLPELLPFIMQSETFHEHSIKQSKGSVNPYVNFSDLARYEVALPPLKEQGRIAKLLWSIESALDAMHRLYESGRLSLQATVDALAGNAERRGSLFPLEDLVEENRPICYGILKPGTGYPGGVPVVKVRDYPEGTIKEDGLLRTDPRIDDEYQRSRLRVGDLLISIRGTVGRLAFVPPSLDGGNITQDTARLSLKADVNHRYVRTMLESSVVQRQIASFITGLAVQGINIGELRKVKIPITPPAEQDELVRKVSAVREALEATELRKHHMSRTRASALKVLAGGSS